MTCEICKSKFAVMKLDRIIRMRNTTAAPEVLSKDVCRQCFREETEKEFYPHQELFRHARRKEDLMKKPKPPKKPKSSY